MNKTSIILIEFFIIATIYLSVHIFLKGDIQSKVLNNFINLNGIKKIEGRNLLFIIIYLFYLMS